MEPTAKLAYELATINAIAAALNQSVALESALTATLREVARLFDLETGWIWLLNAQSGAPYLAAAQNLPPALADNPIRLEGSCYCLDTFREGDLDGAANINVVTCSRLKNLLDGTDGLRYHASIPLYAHGKQLGVLNVASVDWRELSADDLRLLHTVGDLLSIAIERARLYAESLESGAVAERNRLAREIHDTLAQGLAATILHLETADALLAADSTAGGAQIARAVQQALALTRNNLDEARRSVHNLRAAPLEGRTLAAALDALAQDLRTQTRARVTFSAVGADQPLPLALEAGLYRVAQEAFNNIQCHAAASNVGIELVATPAQVTLLVEDDGVGFDIDRITPNRYGLTGMNERVKLLQGSLRIDSAPSQGTRVAVALPLSPSTPGLIA